MGLVKTRRLAAMQPPSPRLRRTGKQQRAILLRQGYGGLKAGMKPPKAGGTRKESPPPFPTRPRKPPFPPNL